MLDFFSDADPAVKELAERNSASLNEAFGILSTDFRRANLVYAAWRPLARARPVLSFANGMVSVVESFNVRRWKAYRGISE